MITPQFWGVNLSEVIMAVGLYKKGTGELKIFDVNKLKWATDNGYVKTEKEALEVGLNKEVDMEIKPKAKGKSKKGS